jgi:hypothetical protein
MILNKIIINKEVYFFVNLKMMFFLLLFVVCIWGGRLLGRSAGNALFPDKSQSKSSYIDNSINVVHHHHHHYNDNRSVHVNEDQFKNLK